MGALPQSGASTGRSSAAQVPTVTRQAISSAVSARALRGP